MESLFNLTSKYEIKTAPTFQSERAELIQKFLNKLNPPRLEVGLKPLNVVFISTILSYSNLKSPHDIYAFYRKCEAAKSFSKYFWWALTVKA